MRAVRVAVWPVTGAAAGSLAVSGVWWPLAAWTVAWLAAWMVVTR